VEESFVSVVIHNCCSSKSQSSFAVFVTWLEEEDVMAIPVVFEFFPDLLLLLLLLRLLAWVLLFFCVFAELLL